ncbi:MAG: prepilin-type N-terminal cleavage/methylation domain-containing protein, partial [Planctomycetota bacterium]
MSQKGFTLIEFLLAFTLGAIILSIIYGVLFTTI